MKNIITILFAIFICLSSVSAQTVTIGETSYNTITEALDAAIDNDVIEITGEHTEAINITKSVTLRGTDPATDIIQAAADQASATSRVIYIDGKEGATKVTLENLTIRNGNDAEHGGGIYADKVTDLFTMYNVVLTNNTSVKNGGGISIGGSNTNIEFCTIENNTTTGEGFAGNGAGMFIAPNNGAAIDAVVNVKNSVISNNTSTLNKAGGVAIDGNHQYGDQFTLAVNFENVTISHNQSQLAGGAALIVGVDYTGSNGEVAIGETNVTVSMVHCTVAYNTSANIAGKSGLAFFNGNATTGPHLSLYNSLIVGADDISVTAIDFSGSNPIEVVNCVLGGTNEAPALIDEESKNNVTGRTSSFVGLATDLSDQGGMVEVLALLEDAYSADFCIAETGMEMPETDARGYVRDATPDAGAFELNASGVNISPIVTEEIMIYPNPAINSFRVNAEKQVEAINLYDITGKLVQQVLNSNEMNVADIRPGLYIVKIKAGSAESVSKLLIK